MFENYLLIAIVIIILWVAGFAFYLFTSRQQRDLEDEVEDLRKMLGGEAKSEPAQEIPQKRSQEPTQEPTAERWSGE